MGLSHVGLDAPIGAPPNARSRVLKVVRASASYRTMSTEARWLGFYNRMIEVFGEEHAETFVNNIATKDDIARLEGRFDRLEERFDKLDDRFHGLYKTIIWTMAGSITLITAIYSGINLLLFG